MSLMTQQYLDVNEEAELHAETGWDEVRKGLYRILLGHLLSIAAVLLLIGVLIVAVAGIGVGEKKPTAAEVTQLEAVILVGAGLFILATMASYALIIRGQWICLIHAPERHHTKWYMFGAITCLLFGPATGFLMGILGGGAATQKAAHASKDNGTATIMVQAMAKTPPTVSLSDPLTYVRASSALVSLASGVLFILFLRAVALCFSDEQRVRFVDTYLVFNSLLIGVPIVVALGAPQLIVHPFFLLGIVGGCAIGFIWYLLLLLSTSGCISEGLANKKPALTANTSPQT